MEESEDEGMDDDMFQELLREATEEVDDTGRTAQQQGEEEEEEKVPLWRAISTMKTSQKVRLAIWERLCAENPDSRPKEVSLHGCTAESALDRQGGGLLCIAERSL